MGQALVDSGESLTTLFYISWGFTTLGLVCFVLFLPPPTRDPPPSLASLLLKSNSRGRASVEAKEQREDGVEDVVAEERGGCREVWNELSVLYTGNRLIQWSVFWMVMYGMNQMIGNYYQNQIYAIDPDAKFGYLEAAMEALAVLGALGAYRSAEFVSRATGAIIFLGSAATGLCYLLATSISDLIAVATLNVIPMGIYGYMITLASALIALDALTPRYAVAFSINTFISLGLATIIQQIAALMEATTNGYYVIAAIASFVLALYGMMTSGRSLFNQIYSTHQ
mmetsp:Transcript_3/g.6  ORF Transcript_3/g.6 Transcript_3/m.6 type:complete len:283 (-) Transcript_3:170-1018(-)|eukprot:CAMPEP_0184504066 /NCGR_PEP_ID=MMETSP0113_2-20130426/52210_1 /TAXON_ID=91329 /ORGANISM="Norrisiella sphaerica, Strain BC52" /LENGTH=282 /DNA_ID=CAMNT_0026893677 /DNA_START=783 /DNA_END=1631 /DNA_ORIENTATION=-